jgi:hypothetical protein
VYVSEGLEQVGQREIVVGVLRDSRQNPKDYPHFPLWLFQVAHTYAQRGSIVKSGDRTIFRSAGSDSDARLAGFIYSDHPLCFKQLQTMAPLGGRDYLIAVPLLSGEAQAAEFVGQARVLALLGNQSRRYPFPWWLDPGRESVINDQSDVGASILSGVAVTSMPYLEVGQRGAQLEVMLRPEDSGALHEALKSAPDVVGLLPRMSHTSHCHFYWRPGQEQNSAIWNTPKGETPSELPTALIGGNFLILTHGDFEPKASRMEDGFAVILSEPLWSQLLAAIAERRSFRASITGPTFEELILRFATTMIKSPFGEYRTSAGRFEQYLPSHARPEKPPRHRVDLEHTLLLTGTDRIAAAIDVESLSLFIDELWAVVDDAVEGSGTDWEHLVMKVHLAPDTGVDVRIAVRGEPASDVFDRLVNRLRAVPAPATLRDEVGFELWMRPIRTDRVTDMPWPTDQ